MVLFEGEFNMTEQSEFESRFHRAVRKMIERKMSIHTFVTHEGKMIHNVDGRYNLSAEYILELDSRDELTSFGVAEYARKHDERLAEQNRPCEK
jgi:hypothetical protein